MKLREALGINVRRLRQERRLSQETFASDAGISREYVSRLENGQENVSINVIEDMAKALKVPAQLLLVQPHGRSR